LDQAIQSVTIANPCLFDNLEKIIANLINKLYEKANKNKVLWMILNGIKSNQVIIKNFKLFIKRYW
jgi:hypothetical protein